MLCVESMADDDDERGGMATMVGWREERGSQSRRQGLRSSDGSVGGFRRMMRNHSLIKTSEVALSNPHAHESL